MATNSPSSGSGRTRPDDQPKGRSPLLIGALVTAVVAVAVLAFWHGTPAPGGKQPAAGIGTPIAQASQTPAPPPGAKGDPPTPEIVAATKAIAAIGPHKQSTLPPIPFQSYAPPRPPEVVTAAFVFAAEHPEVLSYIPCFCGCQQGGHKGNHDCFVRSRAANGDVLEWEPHGVECAVCLDVATRSRQLFNSGASVREIRAVIEKEFVPTASTMTPTPQPPTPAGH